MIRIEIDGVDAYDAMEQMARILRGHYAYAPETELPKTELPEAAQDAKVETQPVEATAPSPVAEAPKKRGRPKKADAAPPAPEGNGNISESPEDRTDPQNPEPADDAETQAADAADEAAETAAAKVANGGKLTHDDVRDVLGKYKTAYGMEAAMVDGPVILQEVCGEGVVKISSIPEDKIGAVIDAVKAAGRANRFNREMVTAS